MNLQLDKQILESIKVLCDLSMKQSGIAAYDHVTYVLSKINDALSQSGEKPKAKKAETEDAAPAVAKRTYKKKKKQ